MTGVEEFNRMRSGGRRAPASCRTKSCIGVIRITKEMRSGSVYRSKTFGVLTWIQAVLGILTIGIYVFLYGESQLASGPFQRTDLIIQKDSIIPDFGAGMIASAIQILGAMVTFLAIHEVNYCWLHLAMSMHILTVMAQSLLSMHTLLLIYPNIPKNTTAINMEGFGAQAEVTKGGTIRIDSYSGEYLAILASGCALASMFIGSFLASATGYSVCCGLDTREKRKSSLDSLRELKERSSRSGRKLVKFGFEPSNVAANLGVGTDEEDRYVPFETNLGTPQDSIIYINRHAQMHRNEPIKSPQIFTPNPSRAGRN